MCVTKNCYTGARQNDMRIVSSYIAIFTAIRSKVLFGINFISYKDFLLVPIMLFTMYNS